MHIPLFRSAVVILGVAAGVGARAQDQDLKHHFLFHRRPDEAAPPPGKPRNIPHTHERAGFPLCLRNRLEPSFTPSVRGNYVGGGAAHGGEPRCWDEGTWGWDDTGCPWLPTRVRLLWTHGLRYQGGPGAYVTDGPNVPDPIAGFHGGLKNLRGAGRE